MINKKKTRLRRAIKARARMRTRGVYRLCVHRTPKHIYAQVIAADGARTMASASSLEKELKQAGKEKGKLPTASKVGGLIARRALERGVNQLAFDRSGYKYHGRIKALAEAAREQGLKF